MWYLFVLFELSCVHMISASISIRICKAKIDSIRGLIVYSVLYGVCLIPFAGSVIIMGPSFLGCKFVLYYSLFYWIGFAWKTITGIAYWRTEKAKIQIKKILDICTVVAFIIYFGLLSRFNIAVAGDGLLEIIIRFIVSVSGIYIVVKTVYSVYTVANPFCKFLTFVGNYTLEVYYIHYIFISFFTPVTYSLASSMGMMSIVFLYFVTLVICAIGIILSKSSPHLSFLLFGRSGK